MMPSITSLTMKVTLLVAAVSFQACLSAAPETPPPPPYVINRLTGQYGTTSYTGDNGPVKSATLNNPKFLSFDKMSKKLLVADSGNFVIRSLDTAINGSIITSIAGTGTSGSTGDGSAATSATLSSPYAVLIDPPRNRTFISDGAVVRVVDNSQTPPTISLYAGMYGSTGYTGDGGDATNATFGGPVGGLAVDASGNLYVADTTNNVIRAISTSQIITTFAGMNYSSGCLFTGDGGQASSANLCLPSALIYDSSNSNNRLLIGDSGNKVIRSVDLGSGTITTLIGNNNVSTPVNCTDATLVSSEFSNIQGLAIDGGGSVYIVDAGCGLIRRADFVASMVTAVAGSSPVSSGTGDGGAAKYAKFDAAITGIAVQDAPSGPPVLFVSESTSSVIRQLTPVRPCPTGYNATSDGLCMCNSFSNGTIAYDLNGTASGCVGYPCVGMGYQGASAQTCGCVKGYSGTVTFPNGQPTGCNQMECPAPPMGYVRDPNDGTCSCYHSAPTIAPPITYDLAGHVSGCAAPTIYSNAYFDPVSNVYITWISNGTFVTFTGEFPTIGWVSIGFNVYPGFDYLKTHKDKNMMIGADITVGFVNGTTAEVRIFDTKAPGVGASPSDAVQNVYLISGSETNGVTRISFTRAINTGDAVGDIPLDRALYLLWAYGPSDNITVSHAKNTLGRGYITANFTSTASCSGMGYNGASPASCMCASGFKGRVSFPNGTASGCTPIPCMGPFTGTAGQCTCAPGFAGTVTYNATSPLGCFPITTTAGGAASTTANNVQTTNNAPQTSTAKAGATSKAVTTPPTVLGSSSRPSVQCAIVISLFTFILSLIN